MSINFWFEHILDAYLAAVADGRDWHDAVAEAERTHKGSRRVLTQGDLRTKGIRYSRQHTKRRVDKGTFPAPFQLPSEAAE
jgi:hypothetical protein